MSRRFENRMFLGAGLLVLVLACTAREGGAGETVEAEKLVDVELSDREFVKSGAGTQTSEFIYSLKARGDDYVKSVTYLIIIMTELDDCSWINDFTGLRRLSIASKTTTVERVEDVSLPNLESFSLGITGGDNWRKSPIKEIGSINCPKLREIDFFGVRTIGMMNAPLLNTLRLKSFYGDLSVLSRCRELGFVAIDDFCGTVTGGLPLSHNITFLYIDDHSRNASAASHVMARTKDFSENITYLHVNAWSPNSRLDLSVVKDFPMLQNISLYFSSYIDDGTAFVDMPNLKGGTLYSSEPFTIPSTANSNVQIEVTVIKRED